MCIFTNSTIFANDRKLVPATVFIEIISLCLQAQASLKCKATEKTILQSEVLVATEIEIYFCLEKCNIKWVELSSSTFIGVSASRLLPCSLWQEC